MANIIRKNQKVFAENAVNNGQFGSLQDTTKVLTQDLDILQANPAYELGWNNATISGEKLPALEEFQSLNYINTSQITYLLNKGIPEWVVDAEYYIGDIQREVAGTKIYRSITDNNIGNILTNITHWVLLGDLANLASNILFNQQIIIANNIADLNNDIDFSAGNFIFSDFSGQAVASALTKRLDAAWVAGTNQGGLDTGAKTLNTWYHCYAIYNSTTLVADFIFSTGATIPNLLPSGFTKFKRVGSIKTNASNNISSFKQRKDYFEWKDVILDLSLASVVATRTNFPISTPLGIEVIANIRVGSYIGVASDLTINLLSTYNNTLTPLSGDGQSNDSDIGSDTTYVTTTNMQIATDTLSQISYIASRASALTLPLVVRTRGYYDYSIL